MKKTFDFLEYWVEYIQKNPNTWRKQHTKFLNDKIKMSNQALNNLLKTKDGKLKLIELRNIKNKNLIEQILKHQLYIHQFRFINININSKTNYRLIFISCNINATNIITINSSNQSLQTLYMCR